MQTLPHSRSPDEPCGCRDPHVLQGIVVPDAALQNSSSTCVQRRHWGSQEEHNGKADNDPKSRTGLGPVQEEAGLGT